MALNLNGEVETKPGAGHRELAANFYRHAALMNRLAEIKDLMGYPITAANIALQSDGLRSAGHKHSVLGFVETAASKIGLDLKL